MTDPLDPQTLLARHWPGTRLPIRRPKMDPRGV
jgi:hypothetical protein